MRLRKPCITTESWSKSTSSVINLQSDVMHFIRSCESFGSATMLPSTTELLKLLRHLQAVDVNKLFREKYIQSIKFFQLYFQDISTYSSKVSRHCLDKTSIEVKNFYQLKFHLGSFFILVFT